MSWMAKLYETYEEAMQMDLSESDQLMPISHTLQNAHINITLDGEGYFKRAEVLEKTQIVLPATENSAGRSSGEAPHPLADKIQYIAKDYPEFGGKKKGYFKGYMEQLAQWSEATQNTHSNLQAIKSYVAKGTVVKDLIDYKILFVDDQSNLLVEWPKDSAKEPPPIFKVLPKEQGQLDQGNALVCWSVEEPGNPANETWKDMSLQQSWIDFELSNSKVDANGLCYITGKQLPLATNHPAKLRHTGDKAKLVSSNDLSGYTFKGRFTDTKDSIEKEGLQSLGIAFEVTQKAHNALRWLISRQGSKNGDQVIVSWAVSGKEIPQPLQDTHGLLDLDVGERDESPSLEDNSIDNSIDLGYTFAISLRNFMAGYLAKFDSTESIVIMGLDSATPGRMAVTYYQEFFPQQYIDQLSRWHEEFAWFQRYTKEKATVWGISSPAPRSIWEAIYGNKISDSLKKNTIARILPSIIEARPFPRDLVIKAIQRASNRDSYKKDEQWLWEKNLGIACSLYRGFSKRQPNNSREYEMALEENNHSRDYLYGRLLAIAENIEEIALSVAQENRTTTAARAMQRFSDHPATTWRNIELALQPHLQRLKTNRAGFLHTRQTLLDNVMNLFENESFVSDKPLSGEFLLAFHVQRLELRKKKQPEENTENDKLQSEGAE